MLTPVVQPYPGNDAVNGLEQLAVVHGTHRMDGLQNGIEEKSHRLEVHVLVVQ